MKKILIYLTLAIGGVLLLAHTTAKKESSKKEYDYLFIEQCESGGFRFYENEKYLYNVDLNRHFGRKYGYYGYRNFFMTQIDSLSNENWEVVQLQNNYCSEYRQYLYSAILKREKFEE